jgi:hypothetical protein
MKKKKKTYLIGESHAILNGNESKAKIGARHGLDAFRKRREVRVDPSFNFRHAYFLGFGEG